MNTIRIHLHRRLTWLVLLTALLLGSAGMRSIAARAQLASQPPVWGRKPVLSYFALTGSLSEAMRSDLKLTDDQFALVRQVAEQEANNIHQLELSSLHLVHDPDFSLAEKRQLIDESGYNQQVLDVLGTMQATLQSSLDEATYTRLVEWIETRWLEERQLHGMGRSSNRSSGNRTYSIFATRFDTGSYIVALPDGCLKIANGGNHLCDDSGYSTGENYSVRLEYKKSTTAKVGDSGPWNVDDNYWSGLGDPQPRRLFPDLPTGMPEAQAAYFDDYNNGEDQFGRNVTAPFGIDLADDVSLDIGLEIGVNDWIDVTFLWTDGWDDISSDVVLLKDPSELTPPYTGDMCETAWHRITGYDEHAYLTLNVNDPDPSTNSAEWRPDFPVSGEYQVLAFVPDHPPIDWQCPSQTISRDTSDATYTIEHSGGSDKVSGDQRPLANMWLDLGTYEFEEGKSGKVKLSDLTDEESYTRTVAFSAMLFRRMVYPTPTPAFTPTPTITPTPTPTPAPFVWVGYSIAPPSSTITIPLGASYVFPGLVSTTLNLSYDPAVLEPVACRADPQGVFDTQACNLDYERNGASPDTLQLSLGSTAGVTGYIRLADVGFYTLGAPGDTTLLDLVIQNISGPGGSPMMAEAFDGRVCIAPCRNINFLPVLLRALLFQ